MSDKSQSTFEVLKKLDVTSKLKSKNNQSYLPWSHAWAEVKKLFPDAGYKVLSDPHTDRPYFIEPMLGIMVMTEVTIAGETLGMWLPVMNGANKAMKIEPYTYQANEWRFNPTTNRKEKTIVDKTVESATMFDINTATMRCLVKNLAMFGLGINVYAGEEYQDDDVKPETEQKVAKKAEPSMIKLNVDDANWKKVKTYLEKNKAADMASLLEKLRVKYIIDDGTELEIKKILTDGE